jgi:hypothetical protein
MLRVFWILWAAAAAAQSTVTVAPPKVTGPVPLTAKPPDPSHGYPFNPTFLNLAARGYVEEEFFLEGVANRYETPPLQTGRVTDGGHPYKTRVVVRRPVSPRKYNGTAIVEWTNVTGGRDLEMDWFQSAEHFVRSGYAWIGVSAQRVGVNALRAWSPARYGTLDVDHGGRIPADGLSYDIFVAAALAIKNGGLLNGFRTRNLIATGHSQSAGRLAVYVNSLHPLHQVFQAVVLHGGGGRIRDDLQIPVWKLLAETDLRGGPAARQPDTAFRRTWEVAGTSHVDAQSLVHFTELARLNAGLPPGAATAGACDRPPYSRVPFHYVFNAAFDHLVRWIEKRQQPPKAPPVEFTQSDPPAIARDPDGNALGGIRLAEHAVPVAVNTGQNSGAAFCRLYGSHEPLDAAKLAARYPSHKAYVAAVKKVTQENVRAGYILKADAAATIAAAQAAKIGR